MYGSKHYVFRKQFIVQGLSGNHDRFMNVWSNCLKSQAVDVSETKNSIQMKFEYFCNKLNSNKHSVTFCDDRHSSLITISIATMFIAGKNDHDIFVQNYYSRVIMACLGKSCVKNAKRSYEKISALVTVAAQQH